MFRAALNELAQGSFIKFSLGFCIEIIIYEPIRGVLWKEYREKYYVTITKTLRF